MTDPTPSSLRGVVDLPASVDPTPEPERTDRIAQVMAAIVSAGADPDDVRFLAGQVWHAGWVAGWDEHSPGAAIRRNPYTEPEQSS